MDMTAYQKDELTGFYKRDAFDPVFKRLIEEAGETDRAVSLVFLDIDEFLRVNDTYGHVVGDAVLQMISRMVKKHIPGDAIPFRYGGDETVVLFPGLEREKVFLLMEKLRQAVEAEPVPVGAAEKKTCTVTTSIGVASYPNDGMTDKEIFRKADQALYKAKVTGRNTVRLAYEERMAPKTAHYTLTQLERLGVLSKEQGVGEAVLLREALDDLLLKYRD